MLYRCVRVCGGEDVCVNVNECGNFFGNSAILLENTMYVSMNECLTVIIKAISSKCM